MPLERLVAAIASRCERIRTGLAVGFGGEDVLSVLRAIRGGEWVDAETPGDLPFEDAQFDVVVLSGDSVGRDNVREANRVLNSDGYLFFVVQERTGSQGAGFTAPEIYKTVREGFDILDVRRASRWAFWRKDRTIVVCARKKAWREHRSLVKEGALPLMPFRSRT